MATTFYTEFYDKAILIPRLQRDYVQGSNTALMNDFIEKLIIAVLDNKNEDLNYIYGRWIDDGKQFIPIDGQQRLTTLWLLHLYAHSAISSMVFPISIIFESREYAQEFCKCLLNELAEIIKKHPSGQMSKHIKNQAWFQCVWYKDRTVKSILSALDIIQLKLHNRNIEDFDYRLKNTESITFKFYPIEGELNDDVYVKMNGRGLPLTDYELLKSWMDGKVEEFCKNKSERWLNLWQNKIDNDWTELIWENRNLDEKDSSGNDISFLIDDEFLRFFYNMVFIYWALLSVNHQKELDMIGKRENEEEEPFANRMNDIARLLNMDKDVKKDDFHELVYHKLMEHFRRNSVLPLYLLDKTNVFTPRLFIFIYCALQELVKNRNNKEKELLFNKSESQLNLFVGANEHKTIFHQIALKDNPSFTELCLLYASIKPVSTDENSQTSFFDWMRVMRNLILGTDIKKENISSILKSIHKLSVLCKKKNIYELLTDGTLKEEVSGFNKSQVEEEIRKAQWIVEDNEWVEVFNELESIAFCKGTINFIFNFLPEQKNKQIFKEYSTLFHLLFGGTGPRNTIPNYYLQRGLMCYTTHYGFGFGFGKGEKWKFMKERDDWYNFLNDSKEHDGQPHNQCMKSLVDHLYRDLSESLDLSHYSEEYSSKINCELLSIIENTDNIKDWRYFFIQYPSIWDEMLGSMCCWSDEYDIVLLHKTRNTDGSKSELRSYAFWQDVLSDKYNNPNDYANWEGPQFFKEGDTCMYINHTCISQRVVAIDLFYERGEADQYRFRLFFRSNKYEESEKTYLATFEELKAIAKKHCFEFKKEDHRYYSQHYSYEDAMIVFKELLKELGKI